MPTSLKSRKSVCEVYIPVSLHGEQVFIVFTKSCVFMYNTCYSNLEVLVISLVRVRVCVPFLHLCLVASRLHLVLEVQRVMHTHVHSNAERSATADWRALHDWLFLHANNGSCCSPGVRSCSDDAVDAALRPLLECAACQPTHHSLSSRHQGDRVFGAHRLLF